MMFFDTNILSNYFYSLIPRALRYTLFPYTTLFRSHIGGKNWLFTGDIGKETERQIMNTYTHLSVDILKVGHHGSNTSDRKSTRLNSSHVSISYAVFCLKKKNNKENT